MKIQVLFFAHLKEKASGTSTVVEVESGAKVQDLKELLSRQYPELQGVLGNVITSINRQFAKDEDVIPPDAEVAFFPPVSGGTAQDNILKLTDEEILIDPVLKKIVTEETGGVCMFTGTVRGKTTRGKPLETIKLQYEAYEEMAYEKMQQIVDEIKSRWTEVSKIIIIQRIGEIQPGEVSVLIACSSSHRDSGIFEAARYGIDRLKEIVPIWKKETTADGEYWVEGSYFPADRE
jgi:MoaE-MoaD fusion protein